MYFESFIQVIHSKTLIRQVLKQVNLKWVIETFIHEFHEILFSCQIFFLRNGERTTDASQ